MFIYQKVSHLLSSPLHPVRSKKKKKEKKRMLLLFLMNTYQFTIHLPALFSFGIGYKKPAMSIALAISL